MKTLLYINIRSYKIERLKPIYAAKKLGYRVVLLADNNPQLDEDILDDVIVTNTYNIEEATKLVINYNEKNKIDGVYTWSDKDVELVAHIGEALGLKTISIETSRRARNKFLMREAIDKVEGLCPKYKKVCTFDDLNNAFNEIGTPAIFKPVGASGSKSIFKINNSTDLKEIYNLMLKSTSPTLDKVYTYFPGEYIYEEYLDGDEVSVEGVVQNNKVFIAGITDKTVTKDFSLEYLEIFPSEKDKNIINEIKTNSKKAIEALQFNDCSFHLEGRYTKNGFKIIEVAARPGGGFIASHVIEYASGHSFLEQVIKVGLGIDISKDWPIFDQTTTKRIGHYDFLAKKEGVLLDIQGLDDAMELEGVLLLTPTKKPLEQVTLPPESFGACYLATTIVEGSSTKDILNTFNKMEDKIKFNIE